MINNFRKYATLVVKMGLNVQKSQIVVINAPIETAEFARIVAKEAYAVGAREVVFNWHDDLASRLWFDESEEDVFDSFPKWREDFYSNYAKQGAAFLTISAEDPEVMKGVDIGRMSRYNKVKSHALKVYKERCMGNVNAWCVVAMPTASWAKRIFPGETEEVAITKLSEAIEIAVRIDLDDPIKAWQEHIEKLAKTVAFLNKKQYRALKYSNGLGTDITVKLPVDHVWQAGAESTEAGYLFVANMPTEEVFTTALYDGVDGVVYSSKPLVYQGAIIDCFWLSFKNGRVVDYDAKVGKTLLTELLNSDEGAKHLGEVALVPYDSPISNLNILFYNTLYDENAACHFALGKAYPSNIKGGEQMTFEELTERGINHSIVHEDFMIGTDDLTVTGITEVHSEEIIVKDGNFAF